MSGEDYGKVEVCREVEKPYYAVGRLITDNILLAFESMHHINQKREGKEGEMALKLDMSKANDRVEWICLEKIMEKLRFAERWRNLIMQCITSVTYAIRINGNPRGRTIPSRRSLVTLFISSLCRRLIITNQGYS